MIDLHELDEFRRYSPVHGCMGDHGNGLFLIPSPNGSHILCVIASNGDDWDHVSVSIAGNLMDTPSWADMDFIARKFFRSSETAVQFHVPREQHVNLHNGCLHLWRPRRGKPMPRPPAYMVGPNAKGELTR